MSPEQREDARRALELLEGSGIKLEDVARLAAARGIAVGTVAFGDAVRIFLRDRNAARLRRSTLEFYENHLFAAEETFDKTAIAELTRDRLRNYFAALPASAPGRWRAMRALWRFGMRQDPPWSAEDPFLRMDPPKGRRKEEPGILGALDADRAMLKPTPWRAAFALWLFAGVRPTEVRGPGKDPLLWQHVDPVAKLVRIPAGSAKTGRTRILEDLPDRFWREIDEPGKPEEPIAPANYLSGIRKLQSILGYLDASQRKRLKPWPHDATRHSFATYHLALYADPGKTSLLLGHEGSPTLLYRHYRGLATKAEAKRWFGY